MDIDLGLVHSLQYPVREKIESKVLKSMSWYRSKRNVTTIEVYALADHNEKNLDSEAASSFVSVERGKGAIYPHTLRVDFLP